MSSNIAEYFGSGSLTRPSDEPGSIVSQKQFINRKTGAYVNRVATNDGRVASRTITKTGSQLDRAYHFPEYHSIEERNMYIRDLYRNGLTQEEIAEGYNLSQPTVSRVLNEG